MAWMPDLGTWNAIFYLSKIPKIRVKSKPGNHGLKPDQDRKILGKSAPNRNFKNLWNEIPIEISQNPHRGILFKGPPGERFTFLLLILTKDKFFERK